MIGIDQTVTVEHKQLWTLPTFGFAAHFLLDLRQTERIGVDPTAHDPIGRKRSLRLGLCSAFSLETAANSKDRH